MNVQSRAFKKAVDPVWRILRFVLAVAATLALASGCGKQGFEEGVFTSNQKSPGSYYIPPKVDILLAEDDTGSMQEAYGSIRDQLPRFLDQIEAKGWNYHFATAPLTRERELSQVVGSKHDINWGSEWVPPYPGATQTPDGSISPFVFTKLPDYTHFLNPSDINNGLNGSEPGLENIRRELYDQTPGTGFLRDDAILAVVVIGNGNDTSGVSYYNDHGVARRCLGTNVGPGYCQDTYESSFQYYKSRFQGLKSQPGLLKFYSAVAGARVDNCLQSYSRTGERYIRMANETGGKFYDVCNQSIGQVLEGLSSHLSFVRGTYRTRYLFISTEPDVATIQVTKYSGGQAISIPQDSTNGWTYAGYLTDAYAIDSPVPLNKTTGWAIELHGSARLVGEESADVKFESKDAEDAS